MSDSLRRIAELHGEAANAEFPLHEVIEGLYGCRVFRFGSGGRDAELLVPMAAAFDAVMEETQSRPVESDRINEVGNRLEDPVIEQLRQLGLDAGRPRTRNGRGQTAGYPDIRIRREGNPVYLEVKATASDDSGKSSLRTFFLSPSLDPKVTEDAHHLLVRFAVASDGNKHSAAGYELKDLFGLRCTLKQEIQSNNVSLQECEVLASSGG